MLVESLQHLHVARGVHVGELQLGNADCGNQTEHDTEEATHHCLGQRCKDGPKLACTSHVNSLDPVKICRVQEQKDNMGPLHETWRCRRADL